ncbi:hypothetical protein Efla_003562 [Eimeria flavescens]
MGAACGKNKAKEPKRADPKVVEENARKEAEEKAAAEAAAREAEERAKAEAKAAAEAAAKAQEEEERAKAEAAAAAAAAAAAEEQARLEQEQKEREEEARRQQEEEQRRLAAAEAERRAAEEAAAAQKDLDADQPSEPVETREAEPEEPLKQAAAGEDVASEATMETSRQMRKVSEPEYGAAHGARKARTVTPCDMTAVDETSLYVSKRCGCHLGPEHDENSCLICQSIDLSDAPLLN